MLLFAVTLCWMCNCLSMCHAATPAALNVQLFADSSCSFPYPDPSYNLVNLADPDVGPNRA